MLLFFLSLKLLTFCNDVNSRDSSFVSEIWDNQYSTFNFTTEKKNISCLEHHSSQNELISSDFLNCIKTKKNGKLFFRAIKNAENILEVGCGTGEMLSKIYKIFPNKKMLGVDISLSSISYANKSYARPNLKFEKFNCLTSSIEKAFGRFSLAICSNTLEHFKDPFVLLDQIFKAVNYCIILVPYKQPITDGYDSEGSLGHVYSFDEYVFSKYELVEYFIFSTDGWQYSSKGEVPLQLAVLLKQKKS